MSIYQHKNVPVLLLYIYDSEINHHYLKRYIRFIRHFKSIEPVEKLKGFEKHHIFPNNSCSKKFSTYSNNLVLLPLRAHFIAHWLLWKAFPKNPAMMFAFNQMAGRAKNKGIRLNSRVYEKLRSAFNENCPFTTEDGKNKIKQTCLKNYGVESIFQSPLIQQKQKETLLSIYGVDHNFKVPEIREKRNKRWKEKYGVEWPTQSEIVKSKISETNLEKYGVSCVFQSEEIKDIMKNTCMEKYGVQNYNQSDEGRKRISERKKGMLTVFDSELEINRDIPREEYQKHRDRYFNLNSKVYKDFKRKQNS